VTTAGARGGRPGGRRLRIAQVAPLYERVPPERYGGTERVVADLTDELVRRGHDVTLVATADSRTRARLMPVTPRPLRLHPPADPVALHLLALVQAFEHVPPFDLIHCHVDYLAFPLARLARATSVHTLHGRLDLPHLVPLFAHYHDVPLVSISQAQRAPLAGLRLTWAGTVHHGVPLSDYPFSPRGGDYLAFLGRLSPEKRPDLAIAVAKAAGIPLKIAAKVDPADRAYFEREVEPLLDSPLVEYLGEIGMEEKPDFLGGARALLFPIDWPEPFGLAMIEAMACGTPVIARRCGSVPEIVEDGRTGLIADSLEDLVAAARGVERISRAACRAAVEQRFSVERMADDYEALYRRLAARPEAA
jgi:glycosyltransferase involved in cell wall biosynthesis